MDVQPLIRTEILSIIAPDLLATVVVTNFAIVMMAAAVILVVAVFWALRRGNAFVGVAITVTFVAVLVCGVIYQMRTADVAAVRREHARNQLEALEIKIRDLERRRESEKQQADQTTGISLPDDKPGHRVARIDETPAEVSAAWLPEVDEQFEADVYPSAVVASRALIRDWSGHFEKLQAKGAAKPMFVRLVCGSRNSDIDELLLLEAMDEKVQELFPDASTLVTTATDLRNDDDLMDNEVSIELNVARSVKLKRPVSTNDESDEEFQFNGILSAAFSGRDWQFSVSARFIEKPWLTATSEFLSLRHGTSYLVLRSSQLASTRDEASRDVLGIAANRLGDLIDPREDQGFPRAASLMMLEQLEAGKYIADRFVQSLKRPYGHVYREALLIDIGNTNLLDMIQVTVNEVRQNTLASQRQRVRQSSGWIGIVVVIGALTALYLLLNWLTKGYYRGPLTVVALLAGSGTILTVAMFVGLVT